MKNYLLIILLAGFMLTSCGQETQSSQGAVSFSFPQKALSVAISKLTIEVTASDMDRMLNTQLNPDVDVDDPNTITRTLNVPVGSSRQIKVQAIGPNDGQGFIGSAVSDVDTAGVTVPIALDYLNFAQDEPGDQFDNPEVFVDPDIIQVQFVPETAASGARTISIAISFAQPVLPGNVGAFLFFDKDADLATGDPQILISRLDTVVVDNPLGVDRYIAVAPNADQPINPVFALLEVDDSVFQSSFPDANVTVFWNDNSDVLTIRFDEDLAKEFMNIKGSFNVLVGNFTVGQGAGQPLDPFEATDSVLDTETAIGVYDLSTLFGEGELDN